MRDITRTIGLSLGADICWPACYELLMKRLDLRIPTEDGAMRFEVERIYIEPFDLRRDCKYDVVIDRLTHWFHTSREWIKKAILLNGLYVFNNPWTLQSMEKHTSYCAMIRLGMPIPTTWLVPPKSYDEKKQPDINPTLSRYAKLFDLGRLGQKVGYPCFVKPYDGGGWRSVVRCENEQGLRDAYEKSGTDVMHVQAGVGYDRFVRTIGFGPQVRHVLYDPAAPLHDRYRVDQGFISAAEEEHLRKVTLTINAFFGWEFNSCESLRSKDSGVWHPIDFANPCPDSQVTSLHYHFPWLVKAYVRWSVFCAATRRRMRQHPDWESFFAIADSPGSYEEKLDRYAALAESRLDAARFEEFCAQHLARLDEVAWEVFGGEQAKQAVRQKVAALYPAHEVEAFTEQFWGRIQEWRKDTANVTGAQK